MNKALVCGDKVLDLSAPVVMGILNVTPDSFSDGGQYHHLDRALAHAETMVNAGAKIIDVGGESTRPGASVVGEQEELDRVVPVVEALCQRLDIVVSVDTSTPAVMTSSAASGAHMLNDVRALEREGALLAASKTGLPICLMHMKGAPESMQDNPVYRDVVDDVVEYLETRIEVAESFGIERQRLLVDPGFGFGKRYSHNYELLDRLEILQNFGLPVLTGLSRKRMIGEAVGADIPEERITGSVSGAVICALKGASILRVHDVRETVSALKVVQAMMGSR